MTRGTWCGIFPLRGERSRAFRGRGERSGIVRRGRARRCKPPGSGPDRRCSEAEFLQVSRARFNILLRIEHSRHAESRRRLRHQLHQAASGSPGDRIGIEVGFDGNHAGHEFGSDSVGARGFGNEIRVGDIEQFHFDGQESIFRIDSQRARPRESPECRRTSSGAACHRRVRTRSRGCAGRFAGPCNRRARRERGPRGPRSPRRAISRMEETASRHASPNAYSSMAAATPP